MTTVVVTDTGGLDFTEALATLQAAGHRAVLLGTADPRRLVDEIPDCEALIISYARVDQALLDRLPRLRVIATTTVGADTIDTDAVVRRGIRVATLPSPASEEVAVHALAGALSIICELPASHQVAAAGDDDPSTIPVPPRLSELTLGLFGLGRIAQQLVRIAAPLVARVVAYDPFLAQDWPAAVERLERADDVFGAADVLSLHAPATTETRGLVNERTLALMRPASYLVNVARGSLVVNDDLVAVLDSGHLRAAFLDVTDPEPLPADHPLLHHPRVQLSPHTAFRSAATLRAYAMLPVRTVIEVLSADASASTQP
jgi:acetolactate synthase-1/2/3 large subunit